MYEHNTLYDYSALFFSVTDDEQTRSAAKVTMELAAVNKNYWLTKSCHGNLPVNRFKATSVMCPVDVYLYDEEGQLLVSIINDEIVENNGGLVTVMNCDGKKTLVYPADKDYRIEIVSREDGEMDYTVLEIEDDTVKRNVDFFDIPIYENGVFEGSLPEEFAVDNEVYRLVDDRGEAIVCDFDSMNVTQIKSFTVDNCSADAVVDLGQVSRGLVYCAFYAENGRMLGTCVEDIAAGRNGLSFDVLPGASFTRLFITDQSGMPLCGSGTASLH